MRQRALAEEEQGAAWQGGQHAEVFDRTNVPERTSEIQISIDDDNGASVLVLKSAGTGRVLPDRTLADFPQEVIVQAKAMVCEFLDSRGSPLLRMSIADVAHQVRGSSVLVGISEKSVGSGFARTPSVCDSIVAVFSLGTQIRVQGGTEFWICTKGSGKESCCATMIFDISTDEKISIRARRSTAHCPPSNTVAAAPEARPHGFARNC